MEEGKTKVILLGYDDKLLKNVSDRVNETRPAEVIYFTDLKDFLEASIDQNPDMIGVSVGFPHKGTQRFPKLFKMVLNKPVLTFGENQDARTRKALSSSQSDLKIQGVITAHNLWMKILNYKKMKEVEEKGQKEKGKQSEDKKSDSVFLKGGVDDKIKTNKTNVLSNLYAALNDPSKEENVKNMNLVSSQSSEDGTEDNTSEQNSLNPDEKKQSSSPSLKGQSPLTDNSFIDGDEAKTTANRVEGSLDSSNNNSNSESQSQNSNDPMSSKDDHDGGGVHIQKNAKLNQSFGEPGHAKDQNGNPLEDNNHLSKAKTEGPAEQASGGKNKVKDDSKDRQDRKKRPTADGSGIDEKNKKKKKESTDDKDKGALKKNAENAKESTNKNKEADSEEALKKNTSQSEKTSDEQKQKDLSALDESKRENDNKNKKTSQSGEAGKQKDANKPEFGKVQLADAKEIKTEKDKKTKEKLEQEKSKARNILKVASEKALEQEFRATSIKEALAFDVTKVEVFTIDMGSLKGYLVITNTKDERLQEDLLLNFRDALMISLKVEGGAADISLPYQIDMDVKEYSEVVSQFADFTVQHKNQNDNGFVVSFVSRETLLPSLEDSDKSDMYLVDIKVIPPQTPVTFDAYLYLPRNQRFVRYLKEGRCLSLKQAKRHTEEDDGQSKLYLPKDQKKMFEKFFIQNTLNWEFIVHEKQEKAS